MSPEAELAALEVARPAAAPAPGHRLRQRLSPSWRASSHADMLHLGQTDGKARQGPQAPARVGAAGPFHPRAEADSTRRSPTPELTTSASARSTPPRPSPTTRRSGSSWSGMPRRPPRCSPSSPSPGSPSAASTLHTLDDVIAAGARRVCVVRAITLAADPRTRPPLRKQAGRRLAGRPGHGALHLPRRPPGSAARGEHSGQQAWSPDRQPRWCCRSGASARRPGRRAGPGLTVGQSGALRIEPAGPGRPSALCTPSRDAHAAPRRATPRPDCAGSTSADLPRAGPADDGPDRARAGPSRIGKDGAVFGNREGCCRPSRAVSTAEYTVPTPGRG